MKRILSGLLITVLFVSCLRKEEDIPMPKLTISEKVVSIGFDRITLSCNVNGNMTVESLHFEYSRTPEFTESKKAQFTKVGDSFTIILMGLERQTTYYYRYTAINRISSFTLDNCNSFITRNGQISFNSLAISNIFPNSAEVSVTIKDDCGGPITERGFCYSTSPNPSVLNNIVTVSSSSNTYSGTLSSLSPATLYYVCAYSKNDTGIYYSDSVQFTTYSGNITFDTPSISNIQPQSATVSVTIRDTGGSTVTERGFCYSTLPNPTVSNSKVTVPSSSNAYSGTLSSLSPSTKYYVRAYAKNTFGTYYSGQVEFATSVGSITFSPLTISNIQSQSATVTVTIQDTGGGTVTERGFCYSTSTNPTVSSSKVTVSSSSNTYSGTLSSLSPSTKYYVRAYAKNASGTYYSSQKEFTTSAGSITFSTPTISNIQSQSATATVTIQDTGGGTITERGFCYSTSTNPTVSNGKMTVSSSSNTYSGTLSSLSASTKYYVRAYAKNASGTYYSSQKEFTTSAGSITFSTPTISNIQSQSATATVTIQDTGGGTITERGFCYSTSTNPTVSNSKVTVPSSNNTYSGSLSSLSPSTKYYVRAYAKNAFGAYYSSQTEFTTAAEEKYVEFEDQEFRKYCLQNFDKNGDGKISHTEAEAVTTIDVCTDNIYSLGGIECFKNITTLKARGSGASYSSVNGGGYRIGNTEGLSTPPTGTSCAKGMLSRVDMSGLAKLRQVDISRNNIVTELIIPASCVDVRSDFCNLKEIEISHLILLQSLIVNCNQIRLLNISKNIQLSTLNCYGNQLTSLDVSKNIQLSTLDCHGNQLTSLDVSNNTQLTSLSCLFNRLTSLDVRNTQLTSLDCRYNQLTVLDVSKNTQLTDLSCGSNQLIQLDVSKNTQLTDLSCGRNQLTQLDVSKNTQLTILSCAESQLTVLDVSKNTQLTSLACQENQLMSLDISKNIQLTILYCYGNQLTSLDVSKNTQLTSLTCNNNQLTVLDVSGNTSLGLLDCRRNPGLSTVWLSYNQSIKDFYYDSFTTIRRK